MQIVFDNYEVCEACRSLWGFSAYFKEYKLLLDTGSNGRVLLQNMDRVGVDPRAISYLFITHSHWDHIGGIDSLVELNPDITLFAPASLSKHLLRDLKSMVKELIICGKKPMRLFDNLYTTGLLGSEMPEQSLIIDGTKPEVITGCGHYGIENITKVAKDFLGKDIVHVSGGFHLLYSDEAKIQETIELLKRMGVVSAEATHCTGDKAIAMFQDAFVS
jgi:7,8-dihydropterin-6-yl-methyl-4-(beta-D-ribofuranosyl)aminobenzene 5'-phosphate synthase